MNEFQQRLLSSAIRAPSGDNCQPWRFEFVADDILNIYIDENEAKSFFDLDYRATYLSIGAVIENIEVAVQHSGYRLDYVFLNEIEENLPVVRSRILQGQFMEKRNPRLLDAVFRRTVNRRPFAPFGVREIDWISLFDFNLPDDVRLEKYTGKEKSLWGKAIKLADVIRWSEKHIHDELFSKIRLTKAAALKTQTGLEIDRLGAGPGAGILMGFLSSWQRFKALKKVGIAHLLASQTRFLVSASAGLIAVWVKADTPRDWIKGGQVIQAIWNKAEMLGIAIQPLPVCLYLNRRFNLEGSKNFDKDWTEVFSQIDQIIKSFNEEDSELNECIMIFRVGKALPMKDVAIRKPLESFIYHPATKPTS